MEPTQQQAVTEKLILMAQALKSAEMKLALATKLLCNATPQQTGIAAELWHKQRTELLNDNA